MSGRVVTWFSCGAASAVAAKLSAPDVIAYCDTGAEHPDNVRFMADCERWFGMAVAVLKSEDYADTWDVWEKERWLAGIAGARCTVALKVEPRLAFQRPDDVHVFGYTADGADMARAKRFAETYPETLARFPLIERGLTKAACLAMVERAGIRLPVLYGMGFTNNNCLPCVKATSANYWALVRQKFPDKFDRMARLARELDVRLCRIDGERAFIDEIPANHPVNDPVVPSCDFLCAIAEADYPSPTPSLTEDDEQ